MRHDDELRPLLELFEGLALKAGRIIMDIRRKGVTARMKEDESPVTAADILAEGTICTGLRQAFPALPIIAEEESATGRSIELSGPEFILIDPLDGTREFICGRAEFTVNIALVRWGQPVLGVVLAPAFGELYSGMPGRAQKVRLDADFQAVNREAIRTRPPQEPLAILASRSHRTIETDRFLARFPQAKIVEAGSSLKFCLIAAGEADLYPRFGPTMEWDTAAGDAILRAAGGMVCTHDGAPLAYGKRGQRDRPDFANPGFFASGSLLPEGWPDGKS